MLGGVILVQQIEGHILQPFLMGRWVSLHPLGGDRRDRLRRARGRHRRRPDRRAARGDGQRRRPAPRPPTPTSGTIPRRSWRRISRRWAADDPAEHPDLQEEPGGRPHDHHPRRHRGGRPACSTASPSTRPMDGARWLSDRCGGEVRLKCENLQRTGSFKMRGAYTRISRLTDEERPTASSPRRPATTRRAWRCRRSCSASRRRSSCRRVRRSPRSTRRWGTAPTWSSTGSTSTTRWTRRSAFSAETGAVLIHPYDHVDIVTGQGTAGLEILDAVARGADRPRADRRRRAARRHRDRASRRRSPTSASSACRRRTPRRTRPRSRPAHPVPPGQDEHDGRRHRGRRPRRPQLRDHPRPRRRHHHRLRGVDGTRAARRRRAGEVRRRAVRRRRGRRDDGRPRRLRDPGGRGAVGRQRRPAAARQGDPARHGGGRPLPLPAGRHLRPARRARRPAHRHQPGRRERHRGRPRADLAAPQPQRGRGEPAARDPRAQARRRSSTTMLAEKGYRVDV